MPFSESVLPVINDAWVWVTYRSSMQYVNLLNQPFSGSSPPPKQGKCAKRWHWFTKKSTCDCACGEISAFGKVPDHDYWLNSTAKLNDPNRQCREQKFGEKAIADVVQDPVIATLFQGITVDMLLPLLPQDKQLQIVAARNNAMEYLAFYGLLATAAHEEVAHLLTPKTNKP